MLIHQNAVYTNIPGRPLEYATTILACVAICVTIPIYIFYWYGPEIRARSKFALTLASDRKQREHRVQTVGEKAEADQIEHIERAEKV